jgi:transposase
MRFPDRGEAARDGIVELGRHELVLDLGRPVRARAASSIPAAPGHCRAGPITALCFKATIDDPTRFKRSRSVGA